MSKQDPIAVLISDLHLSLSRPACRNDEDWLKTQADYLAQVKVMAKTGLPTEMPVVCAGDIFDRWNPPPELIRFALDHLPDGMLSVPGQHDLPNHMMTQKHRSGYGVLAAVGKIQDLSQFDYIIPKKLQAVFYGFGWEQEIVPPRREAAEHLPHVAVIHRYCWVNDKKYPGAPDSAHVSKYKSAIRSYDAAVFGDNHQSFLVRIGDCSVFNCGGFIRRKSDEIAYQPSVGFLFSDGIIKRKALDTSRDVFIEAAQERPEVPVDLQAFIDQLEGLGEHGPNFQEAVVNHLRNEEVEPRTKKLILQSIGQ